MASERLAGIPDWGIGHNAEGDVVVVVGAVVVVVVVVFVVVVVVLDVVVVVGVGALKEVYTGADA